MVIRTFEAFSGYGSQLMALRKLEKDFPELQIIPVGTSEIDENPIKAYNAVHGEITNYGDISKIDWNSVPDFDLFTYSFPCFEAGTLILTEKGYKEIQNITSDDKVLTHTNQFHSVKTPMHKKYCGTMVRLNGMAFHELYCTSEHPFYVRKRYRSGHKNERKFTAPEWVHADKLTKDYYLGISINQKSEFPKWDGVSDHRWGHDNISNKVNRLLDNENFWYLMGRYVGDGWKRSGNKGIVICCSDRNHQSLVHALESCGLSYNEDINKSTIKVHIPIKELAYFVDRYGYMAYGKKIDSETMNLPSTLLGAFLNGYVDSDGCLVGKYYKTASVSKELCYGIGQCVAKVYHRPFAIYKVNRKSKTIIEGREVNQRDNYNVVWKLERGKQDKAFYEDGYIWFPLSKEPIHEYAELDVYNMSVDTDESYTANGVIVHNCQDISLAGYQKGLSEGSGTRSGLLWECQKAIIAKKPKYLLMENVKALVSKKFMGDFQKWLDFLSEQGYKNYWKVLDARDYGVPQHRERTFCVSILGDEEYRFPEKMELTKCIKDYLENPIDEETYYNEKYLQNLHWFTLKDKKYTKKDMVKLGNMFNSNHQSGIIHSIEHSVGTIMLHHGTGILVAIPDNGGYKVKKLSTREMFRLMGCSDEDIDKMIGAVGKTACMKLSGNSIVVDVLYYIFKELFVLK